ncbi:WbqC family protein [Maricaulis sp.]|uniref:WbqC family protein n=1 Tax=Maricaulis sp. TaxID=1486257 RepID=UPI001B1DCB57|nr:WbqC family protein [Maricaulis sp.]MBO6797761.1 WbqC family protein [Maricaulis sp.]
MASKSIGILQPVYLPWLGYFEQIARVDEFVFQDDAQYTKADWRNRNRIKGPQGPIWLTVPVTKAPLDTPINAIEIDHRHRWVDKHLKSIAVHYARAPYRDAILAELEAVLRVETALLSELTTRLIMRLSALLKLETKFSFSAAVPRDPQAGLNDRLLEIAQARQANHIYLGATSGDYVPPEFYAPHRISVEFQTWEHPVYAQQYGPFVSHMSVIDVLMNIGPQATAECLQPVSAN